MLSYKPNLVGSQRTCASKNTTSRGNSSTAKPTKQISGPNNNFNCAGYLDSGRNHSLFRNNRSPLRGNRTTRGCNHTTRAGDHSTFEGNRLICGYNNPTCTITAPPAGVTTTPVPITICQPVGAGATLFVGAPAPPVEGCPPHLCRQAHRLRSVNHPSLERQAHAVTAPPAWGNRPSVGGKHTANGKSRLPVEDTAQAAEVTAPPVGGNRSTCWRKRPKCGSKQTTYRE